MWRETFSDGNPKWPRHMEMGNSTPRGIASERGDMKAWEVLEGEVE